MAEHLPSQRNEHQVVHKGALGYTQLVNIFGTVPPQARASTSACNITT